MISKYLSIGTLAAGALIIGSLFQLGFLNENNGATDYLPRADKSQLQASKLVMLRGLLRLLACFLEISKLVRLTPRA